MPCKGENKKTTLELDPVNHIFNGVRKLRSWIYRIIGLDGILESFLLNFLILLMRKFSTERPSHFPKVTQPFGRKKAE